MVSVSSHSESLFGSSTGTLADNSPVGLKKMPEALVRGWIAELIIAVEALHELGVICGDLALHNVLLGEKGEN